MGSYRLIQSLTIWTLLKEEAPFMAYVLLKEVLKYCENKPEVVDDALLYLWQSGKSTGMKHLVNAVEG